MRFSGNDLEIDATISTEGRIEHPTTKDFFDLGAYFLPDENGDKYGLIRVSFGVTNGNFWHGNIRVEFGAEKD